MLVIPLIWLTLSVFVTAEQSPVVTLPEGQIRGVVTQTQRHNVKFYAYMEIPYAAKPIGNLRFQPPQSPVRWKGVLETTMNHKICYQTTADKKYASEDCLYLNVYTPVKPGSTPSLPVIMNIYGGTFRNGAANPGTRMPEHVMEKGIIVVTMNYRIGPFGFLSTGDQVIPGNMGLKDQQFALKWIQRNIHLFGGDPRKVTIMGQSAGSASVTYQLLSPGSAGLYRAAIGESGSALCTWAHQWHAVDTAYGIAAKINPSITRRNSTAELRNFLLTVSAEAIHKTSNKYSTFAPVIEVPHNGAFITEPMYEAVKNGRVNKVPFLMGFNSEEALFIAQSMNNVRHTAQNYDNHPYMLVDEDMQLKDQALANKIGAVIKAIYVPHSNFTQNLGKTVQYFSDNRFIRGILRFGELYAQHANVYFYQFSYHGKLGGNSYYIEGIPRVTHAEDLRYFWVAVNSLRGYPAEDVRTLDRFVGLLTNFVKTLNPTPTRDALFENILWPTIKSNQFVYLDIDKDLSVKRDPRIFSYRKWVAIYEKYAVRPIISF